MDQNLLILSKNKDDQIFANYIAKVTGFNFKFISSPKDAIPFMQNNTLGALLVDIDSEKVYRNFEDTLQNSIGLLSDQLKASKIHFIIQPPLESASYLLQSPLFEHLIIRNKTENLEFSAEFYARIIQSHRGPKGYTLNTLLAPDTKLQIIRIKNSNQRYQAVEAIRAYLLTTKIQNRIATRIANAADELIMNAIFNAPVNALGHPISRNLEKSAIFPLEEKNEIEMQIGYDEKVIGISIIDFYGSLNKSELLKSLHKNYQKEAYPLQSIKNGAPIGLSSILQAGGSLFFHSDSGVKTEVMLSYFKTSDFINFKNQLQFLSTQFYF